MTFTIPISLSVIPRLTRDQLTLLNAVRTRLSQWQDRKLIKLRNLGKTVDPAQGWDDALDNS